MCHFSVGREKLKIFVYWYRDKAFSNTVLLQKASYLNETLKFEAMALSAYFLPLYSLITFAVSSFKRQTHFDVLSFIAFFISKTVIHASQDAFFYLYKTKVVIDSKIATIIHIAEDHSKPFQTHPFPINPSRIPLTHIPLSLPFLSACIWVSTFISFSSGMEAIEDLCTSLHSATAGRLLPGANPAFPRWEKKSPRELNKGWRAARRIATTPFASQKKAICCASIASCTEMSVMGPISSSSLNKVWKVWNQVKAKNLDLSVLNVFSQFASFCSLTSFKFEI